MKPICLMFLLLSPTADPPALQQAKSVRAEPPPGLTINIAPGRFYALELPGGKPPLFDADDKLVRIVTLKPGEKLFNQVRYDEPAGAEPNDYVFPDSKGPVAIIFARNVKAIATVKAYVNGPADGPPMKAGVLILSVNGAQPPPDDPIVPDVKPVPVTSFRVFIVFESGKNYTPAEIAVMSGKVVEEWLNANCTGGNAGWRRRDQNIGGEADPKFAQLWAAIQPAITTLPAFAVEVNDKVKIIPAEKTPAEMVAKLKLMREGK